MIKLKDLLTEGKIISDVERAAKKIGIKFKKKVKTKFTNDFTGVNEPGENVKYDSWMDMNPPDNYEDMGRDLVDPETYKSVGEGYKMVGQDIYKKVKPLLAKKGGGKAYYKGGKVK